MGGGGGRGEGIGDVCLWNSKEPDYEYVYRIRNLVPPTMARIVVIRDLCRMLVFDGGTNLRGEVPIRLRHGTNQHMRTINPVHS